MNQHCRVLADAVEHDRLLEFRDHLTDDVDALGFELLEVGKAVVRHVEKLCGLI